MTSGDGALPRIQVQLDRYLIAAIDSARGDVSRSMFIRRRLEDWADGSRWPTPAQALRERRQAIDEPVFTGGLVSKLDVPFGPEKQKPGAGLKKGKKP
jgi:hypothetical protein